MGLRQAFESLLRMGQASSSQDEDPVSIVLLLREPRFPTLEQLRDAAGKAFGTPFSGERTARHSVYQQGVLFTLANVGPHTLSFLFYTKPYFDDAEHARAFADSLRRDDQRQVLAAHSAYIAIDYVKGEVDDASKYVVLAMLCAELYNIHCLGIYIPGQRTFVPGEDFARRQLSKIIGSRAVNVK